MTVSMTGGEISPSAYGRVDLAKYQNSLKTCRNFKVEPYGGVKNRPGTEFITEAKTEGKRVRLIPFAFSADQTYVLEFGQGYIRFTKEGAVISALVAATAANFGTGNGSTKDFQLPTTLPHTVTAVYVDGVEQTKTAKTNLVSHPEAFDHVDWIKSGTTVTANSVLSPISGLTADTLDWAHA